MWRRERIGWQNYVIGSGGDREEMTNGGGDYMERKWKIDVGR